MTDVGPNIVAFGDTNTPTFTFQVSEQGLGGEV